MIFYDLTCIVCSNVDLLVPDGVLYVQMLIFSYLTVHGSSANESSSNRRMLLMELMDAHDERLSDDHISVAQGLVLRGNNKAREADIAKRVNKNLEG